MLLRMASRTVFSARFKRQRSIDDPIASDSWTFKDAAGKMRTSRIEIGRPEPIPSDPQGNWFTPIFIEHWTAHVVPAFGAGPVDSLMNAVGFVRTFHEHVGWLQISQGSTKRAHSEALAIIVRDIGCLAAVSSDPRDPTISTTHGS